MVLARRKNPFSVLVRLLGVFTLISLIGALVALCASVWGLHHYTRGLPEYSKLEDYEPPTLTRLHAGDGRLLAEYAEEQRVFVPIEAMPQILVNAFIAAEDKNFYRHPGVDLFGIARALVQNLLHAASGRRLIGASTITQQVAKNFLLTNEVSIDRKIREAILAIRIERTLSKHRILELYLNEIFLGQRSYGVAAASMNYFNKALEDLNLAEAAFLAGLPKAPNSYHPIRNPRAAVGRRNYVLRRMLEDGYIDSEKLWAASGTRIELSGRDRGADVNAPFFAEEVRREIIDRYGEDTLYRGGLSVRTTLDPRLQAIGWKALRDGLIFYDRRHGWRGPITRIDAEKSWIDQLNRVPIPAGMNDWLLAVVLEVTNETAGIGLSDRSRGSIPLAELTWARASRENQKLGPEILQVPEVLTPGDVIAVESRISEEQEDEQPTKIYALRQIPDVEGGFVALDPHTGRILAMVGGWSFQESQFNRVTQAMRQPGSAFKPFVYLAAIEEGYTPASVILDAPFVIDQGPNLGLWKPENYGREFGGPATLRFGIEKSRNLMTVRLANTIGMGKVLEAARRFGIGVFQPHLSIALGSGETTLLKLTAAYAMLVNGGKQISPSLIERIQDRHGITIARRDKRSCTECQGILGLNTNVPRLMDNRKRVTDPATAFQVTWMLKGVVDRGTGRRIRELSRPLAGKTGTTNESFDTWFIGFSPDLVAGVYVGFDKPRTLGHKQTGSNVAAPIFKNFMELATADQPPVPFRIPRGIRMVRIDAETGRLPEPATERTILEAFKPGTEPTSKTMMSPDSVGSPSIVRDGSSTFDSGLY